MNKQKIITLLDDMVYDDFETMERIVEIIKKELVEHDYYTYNRESAEEYEIHEIEIILVWRKSYKRYAWVDENFYNLQIGDRWMLQPPPPNEESK